MNDHGISPKVGVRQYCGMIVTCKQFQTLNHLNEALGMTLQNNRNHISIRNLIHMEGKIRELEIGLKQSKKKMGIDLEPT